VRELKNIDRIFQESLKDFEVFPPNKSWDLVEKQLGNQPTRRRIPIWLKISSIAALLVLFFTVGTIYFIPKNTFTNTFFPVQESESDSPETLIDDQQPTISAIKNSNELNTGAVEEGELIDESIALNDNLNTQLQQSDDTGVDLNRSNGNGFLLPDAPKLPLKDYESKSIAKNDIRESKFTVATIFPPIYFSSFGGGSGLDAQFRNNSTSGNSSYSYGVKFAYRLNNKFSLQSGVNLINLGYKTNDVYVTPGVAVIGMANLSASPITGRPQTGSKAGESIATTTDLASINQVFGYVEIPVEIKYSVTDGKVGVNLVGGFSTLLLNRDEVFVEMNNLSQSLGASNNLRSVNFSGNIGLDVDYSIRKNLFINVSPMFKIQTNTFSKNSGSFQPFYLGVYTGLNYKF
jgi:hypothetical protein